MSEYESIASTPPTQSEDSIQYSQPGGKRGAGPVEHDHTYEDYKANAAIRGIPKGVTADAVGFLEDRLEEWLKDPENLCELIRPRLSIWASIKATYYGRVELSRKNIYDLMAEPVRIFRLQIRELTLGLNKEINEKRALAIRAEIGQEHIKNQAELAELKHFLMQHFESELDIGRSRGQNLYEISKGIMLGLKGK